jgi:hypothetical protein
LCRIITTVAVTALCTGLSVYLWLLVPFAEERLAQDAMHAAVRVDQAMSLRALTTNALVAEQDSGAMLEKDALDAPVRKLQSMFPDFLSLEIIDATGAIVAMGGNLPLNNADFSFRVDTNGFDRANAGSNGQSWFFHYDTTSDSFNIVFRRAMAQDEPWYLRSRFSQSVMRDIVSAVASEGSRIAVLVPSGHGVPASAAEQETSEDTATSGRPYPEQQVKLWSSWWAGPVKAEAGLAAPGWTIVMRPDTLLFRSIHLPVLLPAVLLALALALRIIAQKTAEQTGRSFHRPVPGQTSASVTAQIPSKRYDFEDFPVHDWAADLDAESAQPGTEPGINAPEEHAGESPLESALREIGVYGDQDQASGEDRDGTGLSGPSSVSEPNGEPLNQPHTPGTASGLPPAGGAAARGMDESLRLTSRAGQESSDTWDCTGGIDEPGCLPSTRTATEEFLELKWTEPQEPPFEPAPASGGPKAKRGKPVKQYL